MQLNTQIYNSLGILSDDEGYLKKAADYLKRLAEKKRGSETEKERREMDETEYIMSSPKMLDIIREGDEEIKKGNLHTTNVEDLYYR